MILYFTPSASVTVPLVFTLPDSLTTYVFPSTVTFSYFTTSGSIGTRGDGFTGVKDGSLYENGRLVSAEEGMKYEKVTVDGKTYVVNESGKVKTSGTVTDADGVKYKITKDQNGGYHVEVSW